MRARFIPRILAADPETLIDRARDNFDPARVLACMLQREKSGGHSERSIAIGTIEVALWDAIAKIEGKPLHRVLAERYNGGRSARAVFCYVGGGWYLPGRTIADLQDEMRRHLDAGYTLVKMKIGGLPLADDLRRLEAVLAVVGAGSAARGRRQLQVRARGRARLRAGARPLWAALVRGTLRSARLCALGRDRRPLSGAAGERRKSVLDPGCREPGALRRPAPRSRHHPGRSAAVLRHRALCRYGRHAGGARLAARLPVSPRRQPDVAAHRGRLWPRAARNPIRACLVRSGALRTMPHRSTAPSRCRSVRASASRRNPALYAIMRELVDLNGWPMGGWIV